MLLTRPLWIAALLSAALTAQPEPDRGAARRALAEKIAAGLAGGDGGALRAAFDKDAFLDRALGDVNAPPEVKTPFRAEIEQNFDFAAQLEMQVESGGALELLRLREREEEPTIVYRMLTGNGAVNYFELVLADTDAGVRVVDFLSFAFGEIGSDTIRRMLLAKIASGRRKALVAKIRRRGGKADIVPHLATLNEIKAEIDHGHARAALERYAGLPEPIRRHKLFLQMRLAATQQLGDPAPYRAALAAYEEHVPETDTSRALLLVDAYLMRREFDKAMAAIDTLDRQCGGDPYLDVVRANTMLEKGDFEQARELAERAWKAAPDMIQTNLARLIAALQVADHAVTRKVLEDMTSRFDLDVTAVRELRGFTGFAASPPGKAWLASVKAGGGKSG